MSSLAAALGRPLHRGAAVVVAVRTPGGGDAGEAGEGDEGGLHDVCMYDAASECGFGKEIRAKMKKEHRGECELG